LTAKHAKKFEKQLGTFGDVVAQGFRVRRRRFRVFSGKKLMEPGTCNVLGDHSGWSKVTDGVGAAEF